MVWFVTAYVVVSLSMTKFHHYLLPALPGLGIVIGCFFDDLWSRTRVERTNAAAPSPDLPARWLVGTAAVIGLPALAAITFDLGAAKDAAERFLWLFSYDYVYTPAGRPWPPELEFRPAIFVLGAAFTLATLLIAFRLTRRFALWALPITAILCTLFLLDVFMPKVAAHWSQKPVIARYYRERRSPDERLIAYYLFWRGETFYTKNAIYEGPEAERTLFDHWPDADARLKTWIENHRGNRHYFLFQPSREARLRALLPPEAQASLRIIDRSHNLFVLGVADL